MVGSLFQGVAAFGGVLIVEDLNMTDAVEDWSKVRSPGRARRRRARGHRQNIRILQVPKKEAYSIDGGRTLIMHPTMARQLREAVPELPAKPTQEAKPLVRGPDIIPSRPWLGLGLFGPGIVTTNNVC